MAERFHKSVHFRYSWSPADGKLYIDINSGYLMSREKLDFETDPLLWTVVQVFQEQNGNGIFKGEIKRMEKYGKSNSAKMEIFWEFFNYSRARLQKSNSRRSQFLI